VRFIISIGIIVKFIILVFLPVVLKAQNSQVVVNGDFTTAVSFPVGGCVYTWINSNPSIGLPASGTGDIAAFKAINKGITAVKATINASPISADYAYVASSTSNTVSVVDLTSNTLKTTIPVGINPYGVTLSPDGTRAYVANLFSANVSVINTANNAVIATIPVGGNPNSVVVSPDGARVYVSAAYGNTVSVIDATTNKVITAIPLNYAHFIAISPDGKKLYVSSATSHVYVINTANNSVSNSLIFGPNPTAIVTSLDGSKIYVVDRTKNVVYVINSSTYSIEATIPVGSYPDCILMSSDGKRVYVSNNGSDNVSVISTVNNTVIATVVTDRYPDGISLNADGSKLYVLNNYSNTLSIVNTASNSVVTTIPVGLKPTSLGNFIKSGCYGASITFDITVNSTPVIAATGTISELNTVYGNSSSAQQFLVTGSVITGGILITPPSGFEVSSNNVDFKNTITIGNVGNIPSSTVYLRLKSTSPVNIYQGDIILSSPGAQNVYIPGIRGTITAAPLTISANQLTKIYGTLVTDSASSTAFAAVGLKNDETVGSVTANYGAGAAATASVLVYKGSIKVSKPAGGSFNLNNYILSFIDNDIIVEKKSLVIMAEDKTKLTGDNNPIFTITYKGFVNNENVSTLISIPTINTTATKYAVPGQYLISVSGAIADNYDISYVAGILSVLPRDIVVPNTFTPNGDGINDTWVIRYLTSYSKCIIEIFTRNGNKVFSSVGYAVPWDGKYKSSDLPVGVYYYVIVLNNNLKPVTGYLTILK
jgi:gliding motility-associated-like protein